MCNTKKSQVQVDQFSIYGDSDGGHFESVRYVEALP